MATWSTTLSASEVIAEMTGPGGVVATDLLRRGRRVENKAKRLCPVDNGPLRASITTELRGSGRGLVVRVGTNLDYGIYVHEGTGIYAGRGPITPKRGRFLVFTPRGAGGPVFARSVRGQKGVPFLRDALDAAR